jgi:PAS domain S-box-containing protein
MGSDESFDADIPSPLMARNLLKILVAEGSAAGAEHLVRVLTGPGFTPEPVVVTNRSAYLAALNPALDLIVFTDSVPDLDPVGALRLLKKKSLDVPLVVVGNRIGDELAVECMREGAADVLFRDRLSRLSAAVRAVAERSRRSESARNSGGARAQDLAAIVESAGDAIFSLSKDGTVKTWNRGAERLFGRPAEQVVGKSADFLLRGENGAEAAFAKARQGNVVEHYEMRRVETGSDPMELSLTQSPIFDEGGAVVGVSIVARDVTAQKRAQHQLARARDEALQASHLNAAFLDNVSHEVRTPLNSILGFAGLIAESISADPEQRQFVEAIQRAGKRLVDTIDRVLDVSKIEAENFVTRPEWLDVAEVLETVVAEVRPAAEAKGLVLTCSIEAGATTTWFDRYCLARALWNLLDNAVKFTPMGSIAVRLFESSTELLSLEVWDTGIGMDPEVLPNLFEPFSRRSVGYTRPFQGTGLGMAATLDYLRLNGAELGVESRKGQGSTFTIRFARARESVDARSVPAVAAPEGGEPANGSKRTVLLVEDDELSQRYAATVLGRRFEVRVAATAAEARQRLAEHSHDMALLLLDLSLSGAEDGLMLARSLRSDPRWASVPIIATTAHGLPEDRRNALQAGCTAYLAKPFSPAELLDAVRAVLQPGRRATSTPKADKPRSVADAKPAAR